jgi:hypothetical protein
VEGAVGVRFSGAGAPFLTINRPKYFGFDKNGACAAITAEIDPDKLTITWSVSGAPNVATGEHLRRDFAG